MSFDANAVLGLGYGCLIAAFILSTFCLFKADEFLCAVAFGALGGGVMLWAAALIWRLVERGILWSQETSAALAGTPFSLLALFPLSCGAIVLMMEREYHTKALSPLITLVVLGIGGYTLFAPSAGVAVPHWVDGWFVVYHLGLVFSYSLFLVAGAAGTFELLRPALNRQVYECQSLSETATQNITVRTIRWAMILLSAALAVGGVRSWLMTGSYWNWTLIEMWTLVIWAVYGAYLHLGRFRGWAIAAALGTVLVASAIGAL